MMTTIKIDCPYCGSSSVNADAYLRETNLSFHFIPVAKGSYTRLACTFCHGEFSSRETPESLEKMVIQQRNKHIHPCGDFFGAFLAFVSVLFAAVPVMGIGFSFMAFQQNRFPNWKRSITWLGLALSVITTIVFAVLIFNRLK